MLALITKKQSPLKNTNVYQNSYSKCSIQTTLTEEDNIVVIDNVNASGNVNISVGSQNTKAMSATCCLAQNQTSTISAMIQNALKAEAVGLGSPLSFTVQVNTNNETVKNSIANNISQSQVSICSMSTSEVQQDNIYIIDNVAAKGNVNISAMSQSATNPQNCTIEQTSKQRTFSKADNSLSEKAGESMWGALAAVAIIVIIIICVCMFAKHGKEEAAGKSFESSKSAGKSASKPASKPAGKK